MAVRFLTKSLQEYRVARTKFVQTIAEFSSVEANIVHLEKVSIVDLLKPLIGDIVPSIRQASALALGRIANYSEKVCKSIVQQEVLPQLVKYFYKEKYFRKTALFVLRAVCKHSEKFAHDVVDAGGITFAIDCLSDYQTDIKVSAAWLLGYIARQSQQLSLSVIQSGAVPLLFQALQEPKLCLKQIAANAICDVSRHDIMTVEPILDAGGLPILRASFDEPDVILKRSLLAIIVNICKASEDFVEDLISADLLPLIMEYMKFKDEIIQKNATSALKEIIKHSSKLAEIVVDEGGIECLLCVLQSGSKNSQTIALVSIGLIAAQSSTMAMNVIEKGGDRVIVDYLFNDDSDSILCAVTWCLGQLVKHTPEPGKVFSDRTVVRKLLDLSKDMYCTSDLRNRIKDTLKSIVQRCLIMSTLTELLHSDDPHFVKMALAQIASVVARDKSARIDFVVCGGLKKVQELKNMINKGLSIYQNEIKFVNLCYPKEFSHFYSYTFPEEFLDAAEQYTPDVLEPPEIQHSFDE